MNIIKQWLIIIYNICYVSDFLQINCVKIDISNSDDEPKSKVFGSSWEKEEKKYAEQIKFREKMAKNPEYGEMHDGDIDNSLMPTKNFLSSETEKSNNDDININSEFKTNLEKMKNNLKSKKKIINSSVKKETKINKKLNREKAVVNSDVLADLIDDEDDSRQSDEPTDNKLSKTSDSDDMNFKQFSQEDTFGITVHKEFKDNFWGPDEDFGSIFDNWTTFKPGEYYSKKQLFASEEFAPKVDRNERRKYYVCREQLFDTEELRKQNDATEELYDKHGRLLKTTIGLAEQINRQTKGTKKSKWFNFRKKTTKDGSGSNNGEGGSNDDEDNDNDEDASKMKILHKRRGTLKPIDENDLVDVSLKRLQDVAENMKQHQEEDYYNNQINKTEEINSDEITLIEEIPTPKNIVKKTAKLITIKSTKTDKPVKGKKTIKSKTTKPSITEKKKVTKKKTLKSTKITTKTVIQTPKSETTKENINTIVKKTLDGNRKTEINIETTKYQPKLNTTSSSKPTSTEVLKSMATTIRSIGEKKMNTSKATDIANVLKSITSTIKSIAEKKINTKNIKLTICSSKTSKLKIKLKTNPTFKTVVFKTIGMVKLTKKTRKLKNSKTTKTLKV